MPRSHGRDVAHRALFALLLAAVVTCACDRDAARSIAERLGIRRPWYERESYQKRLAAQAQANHSLKPPCTLLLGDSIVENFPTALTRPRSWINRGISGDRSRLVLRRIETSALATPCTDVVLMVGINDLIRERASTAETADGVWRVVAALREAGRRVWLTSLLPVGGLFVEFNESVRDVNAALRSRSAEDPEVFWMDLTDLYADTEGHLQAGASDDGLHLLPRAYAPWAARLERSLAAQRH